MVYLVGRLQAGELLLEAGEHVDGIWLEFPQHCWVGVRARRHPDSQRLLLIHSTWVMRELPSLGCCGTLVESFLSSA